MTKTARALGLVSLALLAHEAAGQDLFSRLRRQMVERLEHQIRQRGVEDDRVLQAMDEVPRHLFVPETERGEAYTDAAVPMGGGTTIYQPYVVALMTSLLDLDGDDRVLEIGTGSGYHTAVLTRMAKKVYTIEIRSDLAQEAKRRLERLGYRNFELRVGDGYEGWPEKGPFDAILLTAAPPSLPQPLIDQLKVGGKMVVPVGGDYVQDLQVITKTADGHQQKLVMPVRVVPMDGEVRKHKR